jgi:hypothetical protein
MTSKALLAASAALPLLAAAGAAHATVVATNFPVSMTGTIPNTEATVTTSGTGTGSLDNAGAFPYGLTTTVTVDAAAFGITTTAVVTGTDSFGGTFAAGTLTVTSATEDNTSCTGSSLVCTQVTLNMSASAAATGSITLAGGSVTTGSAGAGLSNFTIGAGTAVGTSTPPPAVPLPPAVWLLGSGLLGLIGTARRRMANRS